jgi:hypothetical protein
MHDELRELGLSVDMSGRLAQAADELASAIELLESAPGDRTHARAIAHRLLAEARLRLGDDGPARAHLQSAGALWPHGVASLDGRLGGRAGSAPPEGHPEAVAGQGAPPPGAPARGRRPRALDLIRFPLAALHFTPFALGGAWTKDSVATALRKAGARG